MTNNDVVPDLKFSHNSLLFLEFLLLNFCVFLAFPIIHFLKHGGTAELAHGPPALPPVGYAAGCCCRLRCAAGGTMVL